MVDLTWSGQCTRVWCSTKFSAGTAGSLQHSSGESHQQADMKISVKNVTYLDPTGSCDEAGFLSNMVLRPESTWAGWDCQDEAKTTVTLSIGHAYPVLRDSCS